MEKTTVKEPIMNLRKVLPIAAASALIGLVLGATVLAPGSATAQETPDAEASAGKVDRWEHHLQPLVDDGTITQDQAVAVAEHLAESIGGGRFVGRLRGLHTLAGAAEIIGIEPSEMREALAEGSTLAEVAEANGVDVQTLINGLVASLEEKLDDLVSEGRLDEAQAARIVESAPDRIAQIVNSQVRRLRGFWLGG